MQKAAVLRGSSRLKREREEKGHRWLVRLGLAVLMHPGQSKADRSAPSWPSGREGPRSWAAGRPDCGP